MITYTFIKSHRRTISISVKLDGSVIVRVPLTCTKKRAEAFVMEKQAWIEKSQKKMAERRAVADTAGNGTQKVPAFTDAELAALKKQAKKTLPAMAAEMARTMSVTYGIISIRAQKTRWGSCSSKGNLNFNCLLMLLPENIQRYVVVHELCHRKEMNHSDAFWREVAKYQPTYKDDRKQLKELGRALMMRLS